jgi:hypothetical protein
MTQLRKSLRRVFGGSQWDLFFGGVSAQMFPRIWSRFAATVARMSSWIKGCVAGLKPAIANSFDLYQVKILLATSVWSGLTLASPVPGGGMR